MVRKTIGLGVPRALTAAFPLTPHEATKRWCKKLPTPAGAKVFYFGAITDRPRSVASNMIEEYSPAQLAHRPRIAGHRGLGVLGGFVFEHHVAAIVDGAQHLKLAFQVGFFRLHSLA
jgi:hypothetical protein